MKSHDGKNPIRVLGKFDRTHRMVKTELAGPVGTGVTSTSPLAAATAVTVLLHQSRAEKSTRLLLFRPRRERHNMPPRSGTLLPTKL